MPVTGGDFHPTTESTVHALYNIHMYILFAGWMFYDLNAEFQEILLNINISIIDTMRKIMGIHILRNILEYILLLDNIDAKQNSSIK